jgi:hypothetical protein
LLDNYFTFFEEEKTYMMLSLNKKVEKLTKNIRKLENFLFAQHELIKDEDPEEEKLSSLMPFFK